MFSGARGGITDLYMVDVDGGNFRQLTNDKYGDLQPSWSPDGTRIAYYTDVDGNFQLFVMNADGSGRRQLTRDPVRNGAD